MPITFRGVGAAAAALNASVNPALFESPTAGDLLLCYGAAREAYAVGTITAPAGWSTQFAFENTFGGQVSLYYKIASGGDANPTVGITGTPDAVQAQCCAFRGINTTTPFGASGANFFADNLQNIGPILGFTPLVSDAVVVVCGEKNSTWTSVDLLTGDGLTWVEIGEPTTLLGGDLSQVWDYAIIPGAPITISSKTFTVNGVASQPVSGKMVSLVPSNPAVLPSDTPIYAFGRGSC